MGTSYSHTYHNIFKICTLNLSISFTMNANYRLLDIILVSQHHELRYDAKLALNSQHPFLVIKSIVTEIYNFYYRPLWNFPRLERAAATPEHL